MRAPRQRKLGVYSLGILRNRELRDALALLGWRVCPGWLTRDLDAIGVWGATPTAERGHRGAKRRGLPIVYLEDAPLRSVGAGRGEPLMGLTLDETGNPLDASAPSDLENLLNAPSATLSEDAEALFDEYLRSGLSKYNTDWSKDAVKTPFVLVVDQLRDDASIRLGAANAASFREMLETALREHPDKRVLVKRHPRAEKSPELGHFDALPKGADYLPAGLELASVLQCASAVYAVTSQVGLEAIFHGHEPVLFGLPYYAGWGLSLDRATIARRHKVHSPQSLFDVVMLRYPVWVDVYSGARCSFQEAMQGLVARRRAAELRVGGAIAVGMRLWKRPFITRILGPTRFVKDIQAAQKDQSQTGRKIVAWASAVPAHNETGASFLRMEDGFLRSQGLGANLTEPVSCAVDDLGIYYDPTSPSRLEWLIEQSRALPDHALKRAENLRSALITNGLSKYNVGGDIPDLPGGKPVVLVPGQVEDDASILKGAESVRTNLALLQTVRKARSDACILYKPHPDVEAGLRPGALNDDVLGDLCDFVLRDVSAEAALKAADEVWTMTSLLGFEALVRQIPVTTLGRPFYAGWGLTTDLGGTCQRRQPGISLQGLIHAALIDYPHYYDPNAGLACSVERAVKLLSSGELKTSPKLRAVAKLQGALAGHSWLWR